MDNKKFAVAGETVAGAAIGAPCGHVLASGGAAACEICGVACAVGAVTGAVILCAACYVGTKYSKLHPVGKGAVVISSTGVGAFTGASVVESAAIGAGVAASLPAMIAGAAVGVVVVGGAVVIGHLAASADDKANLQGQVEEMRGEQDRMKTQMDNMMTMIQGMQNNKKGGS
ncbi:uncharacterized protein LOC117343736 isoform X2 [Pecten maximus]|uniref:uncharacterized protein LOC117343736 isoform X2 n=1 Tax=Pecten maximus TaxID=6579 RepID=UPI0014580D1F|nr:uncharacterized protein LOC117343736 isoform X2 [Pecten maximus]